MKPYDLSKPILKERKFPHEFIKLKNEDLPEDINYIKEQIETDCKTIKYIKKKENNF